MAKQARHLGTFTHGKWGIRLIYLGESPDDPPNQKLVRAAKRVLRKFLNAQLRKEAHRSRVGFLVINEDKDGSSILSIGIWQQSGELKLRSCVEMGIDTAQFDDEPYEWSLFMSDELIAFGIEAAIWNLYMDKKRPNKKGYFAEGHGIAV